MEGRKLLCSKCGRDITRTMKFYYDSQPYCYDCSERRKEAIREAKLDETYTLSKKVRIAYKRGLKPSDIAEKYGISKTEVYERLNGER